MVTESGFATPADTAPLYYFIARVSDLENENDTLRARITELEGNLAAAEREIDRLQGLVDIAVSNRRDW
jgi:hypothetical protein